MNSKQFLKDYGGHIETKWWLDIGCRGIYHHIPCTQKHRFRHQNYDSIPTYGRDMQMLTFSAAILEKNKMAA